MAPEKRYSPISDRQPSDESTPNVKTEAHQYQPYSEEWHPNEQTWRLLREHTFRWACTLVIVVLFITCLKVYENEGNVTHDSKIAFNTITTILSLALGLNFLEAFKDMAKVLRWRVLANRRYTVREMDLILGGESLMKLLTLMWEAKGKPLVSFVCLVWIALNLLAQAAVAMISLTYSFDGGNDSTGITTSNGTVNAPKLDCYYDRGNCTNIPPSAPETSQTIAHLYGEIVSGEHSCEYTADSDILSAPQNCSYFVRADKLEFAYRYAEYNLYDRAQSYPFLTDRIIKVSSGQCYQYTVNWPDQIDTADGGNETFAFPIHNDTYHGTLNVPKPNSAFDSTTYIWNSTTAPQNTTDQSCGGSRCVWLYAFRSLGILTNRTDLMFQCPITVSEVQGAWLVEHQIADENARLAGASIALSGRYFDPVGPITQSWQQYQMFPFGSYWETNNLTAAQVGTRMSEFALGSLASMAALNPMARIPGTVPTLGYHLSVHWNYLIALAACIAGVHTVFVLLILAISRPVVVGPDSNLAVARLLGGIVGRLGGRGSLLDGKKLAEAVEGEGKREGRVTYGVREVDGQGEGEEVGRVLEMSDEVVVRKRLVGESFPQGVYL